MFNLGKLVQTQGIAHLSQNDPIFANNIKNALARYKNKDWGDLCDSDKKLNDEALKNDDDRILASYNLKTQQDEQKVYIITECDRSVTTILFANEY